MAVLERSGQPGDAGGAIALANQVLRRSPTLDARDEDVEPIGQVLDIRLDTEEGLPIHFVVQDAGEAGVDRVDVDDVGDIEDGVRIVAHAVWLHRITLVIDDQQLGAGVAEVHPQRAGARPAVERDEQRSTREVVDVGSLVEGVVKRRDRFVLVAVDRLRADRHTVLHALAADRDFGVLAMSHVGG